MGTDGREVRIGEGLSFNLPQHSPHITSIQYCEGCALEVVQYIRQGDNISTVEVAQYSGDSFSTVEVVQYSGG